MRCSAQHCVVFSPGKLQPPTSINQWASELTAHSFMSRLLDEGTICPHATRSKTRQLPHCCPALLLAAGCGGGVSGDMCLWTQRVSALYSRRPHQRVVHAAPGPVSAEGNDLAERLKVLPAKREDRPFRVLVLPPTLHGLIAHALKLQADV